MLGTIKLNTIKNKLNDFELKACVYISSNDVKNNNEESFSPYYYNHNKSSFYIICSNKRTSSYWVASYSTHYDDYRGGRNILLAACDFEKNNLSRIYNIDLERFLLISKNSDFLGWHPYNDLIDQNIESIRGNKHCKHYKDKIYYGVNKYNVDVDKLHLFVRIIPKDCNDLTSLIVNCERDNIYNISELGDVDKVGTLGFIIKLNDRHEYVYSKVFSKITRIKYPFLTKNRINELLFGGYEANYSIKKEIIYVKDNSKLDTYGIKVLDNF